MRKWTLLAIAILFAAMTGTTMLYHTTNKKLEAAMANVKAYDALLSDSRKQNAGYQLTIDQLGYFKDSLLKILNATRKELKIKDKNLKSLHYVYTSVSKTDTLIFRDTLFREATLDIDTLLGDEWYDLKIGIHYPSTITVRPTFRSQKHIVVSTRKETLNPPKKFFLFRWFQKKHQVLNVDVVEKNPYVREQDNRYVEILR